MIGDYVLHLSNKKPDRVFKVCEQYVKLDDGWYYFNDEIAPIPLTAEILVDSGFEQSSLWCDQDYLTFRHGEFRLFYNIVNNEFTIVFGAVDLNIRYVHELQHVLSFCHIECDIIINPENIY